MTALRTPVGVWTRHRATPVLLVALAAPLALLALAAADAGDGAGAGSLMVGTASLGAAVLLSVRQRLRGASGRVAGLLAVTAVPEVTLGAGTLAGRGIDVPTTLHPTGALMVVLAVLAMATAVGVLRDEVLPAWARTSLAAGVLGGLGWTLGGPAALGSSVLAAALVAGTSAVVLHHAVKEEKREVEELLGRLQTVEGELRDDRARLHEINATVAGIASAQTLLSTGLPADHSDALTSMVRAEVERLQRLVADRAPTRRRSVDLDEVLGQIVLSHLARGRVVLWEPAGLRALGRSDDIAEVVNVLLENAAVHGGPDAVTVQVARDLDGYGITITVADQGPGIDSGLRARVFDWGVSRPDSPGQGIGLHVAAEISQQLGGRLELLPTQSGAAFALHLPAVPREVSADERVARAS